MKKLFLAIVLVLANFAGAMAQNLYPMKINGLIIGEKYSDAQVRSALGTPTRYSVWDSEMGGGREYQYGPVAAYDVIRCDADGLSSFGLFTSRFSLFDGRLRVGDSLSKIYQIGFSSIEAKENGEYYCDVAPYDDPLVVKSNGKGVIVCIYFMQSN